MDSPASQRPAPARPSLDNQTAGEATVPSFTFSGCGFLGVYYIGVIDCLQTHIPYLLQDARFAGASAGALMAAGLACGLSMDMGIEVALKLATQAQKCPLGAFDVELKVDEALREILERYLPSNAHELCTGRLYVSVSQLKNLRLNKPQSMLRNDKVSSFRSRDHLIDTTLCSCYIPVFSGSDNPILDNEITMDGAFTDNQPRIDENTITICPFAGDSDICPKDSESHLGTVHINNHYVNLSLANLMRLKDGFFVPSATDIPAYYRQGYDDALRFLTERNLVRCPAHPVPLNQSLKRPADPIDCEACKNCVQLAHDDKALDHDEHFLHIAERIKELGLKNKGPSFSMIEVLKLGASIPREVARVIPTLARIASLVARGTPEAMQAVDTLLHKKEMRELLRQLADSATDQHTVMKTILLRSSTLSLWKTGALLCRVLGYVASTRLWQWFSTYYREAVRKNKLKLAEMKAADGRDIKFRNTSLVRVLGNDSQRLLQKV